MGKINSRAKGASAERELIAELRDYLGEGLTANMKRNLEQSRKGGHDIAGLDGWAIEVKRYKSLSEAEIARIWERQAVDQAWKVDARPALAYRGDYKPWRVRVPMALIRDIEADWKTSEQWLYVWTVDIGLQAFASLVLEQHSASVLRSVQAPQTIEAPALA